MFLLEVLLSGAVAWVCSKTSLPLLSTSSDARPDLLSSVPPLIRRENQYTFQNKLSSVNHNWISFCESEVLRISYHRFLSPARPDAKMQQQENIPPVISRQWTTWSQRETTFSLMSYNILAPVWSPSSNYQYMPAAKSSWEWRRRLILAEIGCHKPDIVCFQVYPQPKVCIIKPILNALV